MYTKEQLEASSLKTKLAETKVKMITAKAYAALEFHRDPETVYGTVMSNEEVDAALARPLTDNLLIHHSITLVTDQKAFFLTDDHSYGYKVLPPDWVGCSMSLPMRVPARPEVPSGVIETAAQLVAVFASDMRQLNTVDELVAYLNEES